MAGGPKELNELELIQDSLQQLATKEIVAAKEIVAEDPPTTAKIAFEMVMTFIGYLVNESTNQSC